MDQKIRVFVTGGAGYIGSHFVKKLSEESQFETEILVYDNLSSGNEKSVLYGDLVVANLEDQICLKKTLQQFNPHFVVHFAASIKVEESMREPYLYYKNNTQNTLNLLSIMEELHIPYFLFSSTAAVYGMPESKGPILEETPFNPINVYGDSKAMVENVLWKSQSVLPFKAVTLRYFNVAGADPQSRIGQLPLNMTHLIGRTLEVALGKRDFLGIYGDSFDTIDGTCIRDYIHVEDLAKAHIDALSYLIKGNESNYFNLGYGKGFSVKEIVKVAEVVTGKSIKTQIEPPRDGDPVSLVADNKKAISLLNWQPDRNDINDIIEDAWNFLKKYFNS